MTIFDFSLSQYLLNPSPATHPLASGQSEKVRRHGGSLLAFQTSEALVPGSNPSSLEWKTLYCM